jgi:uroporphyrinogen III methyltransferase/synthase
MGTTNYQLHPEVLEHALQGKTVVRLKSGDPLIFGRGGEEAEALRDAGIDFEFVPGITAALGAASYAGIPLTHRGLTTQVLIDTGHDAEEDSESSDSEPLHKRMTVLYMSARRLQANLQQLGMEGYPADTPAALIASATTPRQQVYMGTLATLAEHVGEIAPEIPAILFVGTPVALHEKLKWFLPSRIQEYK